MKGKLKEEFQLKNVSLGNSEIKLFEKSQWFKNRVIFLVYRVTLLFYCLGWLIAFWVTEPHLNEKYTKATHITELMMILYMVGSSYIVTRGMAKEKDGKKTMDSKKGGKLLHIVKCLTWLFHTLSFNTTSVIVVGYWGIFRKDDPNSLSAISIHKHAGTFILFLIDMLIVAFPVRLLHWLYVAICWGMYVLLTLIIHWLGINSRLYSTIHWDGKPLKGAIFSVCLVLFGSLVSHVFLFGLFCMRICSSRRCKTPKEKLNKVYYERAKLGEKK